MEIRKDNKNELMARREVSVVTSADKTPSFVEASKAIGEHFKSDEDKIMVEGVKGKFGRKTFLINASIYNTKELKEEAVKRLTKQKKAKTAEAAPAA
jgi:ribosomal protein S24E